ncbi:hypothetical protein RHOM_07280 [Roseburia hominis A2-183]|uniref:Uncharacterized protein n=1 Tax=Roseburia hominis (strain DSM 16839 / JCM 17582 / NCIMB 14029 / A2-183) TaxID=585394 RepID=G2T3J8_ROSHA|nr:hypothetical protein RHOM_07280 [Roseburia hominis A2-183]
MEAFSCFFDKNCMFISLKFSHTIPEQTQMAQVQTKSVTKKSKTDKVIITMITKDH